MEFTNKYLTAKTTMFVKKYVIDRALVYETALVCLRVSEKFKRLDRRVRDRRVMLETGR